MDQNPYQSPREDAESPDQLELLLLSPLRIPIAISSGVIVLLLAVGIGRWVDYLATFVWDVEVAFRIIPALLIEAIAFGLIAWGLAASMVRPIYWGLALFVLGIVLVIAMPALRGELR